MLKYRNSYLKLLVILRKNAQAGKKINVSGSSHRIRPEQKEHATKSLEKWIVSQSPNRHIALLISGKKDLFVRNTATLNVYWQTVYVNARRIRYAVA